MKIAVSQCLLGDLVRYNGESKPHPYIRDSLTQHVQVVAVCPEVEAGMGVPRPPVQLRRFNGEIRALRVDDPSIDETNAIRAVANQRIPQLHDVCAFVFKSRSPSCGLGSTPVDEGRETGHGIFSQAILSAWPQLPLAEESVFDSFVNLEQFIEAACCYHDWLTTGKDNPQQFVKQHAWRWALKTGRKITPNLRPVDLLMSLKVLLKREERLGNIQAALTHLALFDDLSAGMAILFSDDLSGDAKYGNLMFRLLSGLKQGLGIAIADVECKLRSDPG